MGENQEKQDKPEKKLAPPIMPDPKLEKKVELGEKMPSKKVIEIEIER